MTAADRAAPTFVPEAQGLSWPRRAIAQGAGYLLPSSLFALIPVYFVARGASPLLPVVAVLTAVLLVFFLGSSLVCHWAEGARWLWVAGLIASVLLLAAATRWDSRPEYYTPYATAVIATLITWRHARIALTLVSLVALALGMRAGESFAVIMPLMGLSLGWSVGAGLEADRAREGQRRAEERLAVVAVAAERERIGRDLHDILGHSLTAIAVQADLIGRLIGRDDEAARRQVADLGTVARGALGDVRATVSRMREVRLATELASARSVLGAADIECVTPSPPPTLSDERAELFGYVVREAVTNVVRHAGAGVCTITTTPTSVEIIDDGQGIRSQRRTGLAGLARRVEAHGGSLVISTGPSGTRVRAEMGSAA